MVAHVPPRRARSSSTTSPCHHLYLPPFVAHGFQVTSDEADVCYLHSRSYEPGADLALAWDDPTLAIDWPIQPPVVSARDTGSPRLDEVDLTAVFDPS